MNISTIVSVLLVLLALVAQCGCYEIPRNWTINLDKAPEDRWPWHQLLPIYKPYLLEAQGLIGKFLPSDVAVYIEDLAADLTPYLGSYGLEIQSLSKALNISMGKLVLLNIIYEVEAGCTSIVARNTLDKLFHGRNLDFDLAPVLRNLTVKIDFTKNNKILYTGVSYIGYFGLLTGVRKGGFTISADQRTSGYVWENLLESLFIPGTTCAAFLIRDTLEQESSYDAAVRRLSETSLAAPIYLIVGGTKGNEGVVITRDRMWTENKWILTQERWFEVETNYDHWKNGTDPRRKAAQEAIEKIGQDKIDLKQLMTVLSTPPVKNPTTTYTALMAAETGECQVFIRDV